MQPTTQSTHLSDADSFQFGFIVEHVQWLKRTWNEGGVGTKIGLICLIAGECLLGIASIFGLPLIGLGIFELYKQNSIPLNERDLKPLNTRLTSSVDDVVNQTRNLSSFKEDSKLQIKEDSKPQIKEDSKPQIKEDSKPQIKEDSKPQIKEDSKPQIKEDSKPQIKEDSKPQVKEDPESQIQVNQLTQVATKTENFLGNVFPSLKTTGTTDPIIKSSLPVFQMGKFMESIRKNRLDEILVFENQNINLNEKDKDGNTPLHLAIEKENLEIVKFVLRKNALLKITNGDLLEITNDDGNTPLQLAAENFKDAFNLEERKISNEIINLLIENNADIEKNRIFYKGEKESFFCWVCRYSNDLNKTLELILPLAKRKNIINQLDEGCSVLAKVAGEGNKKSVELLLKYGAELNIQGQTKAPLQLAAESFSNAFTLTQQQARSEVINLLIENNADIEKTRVNCKENYETKEESFLYWVCSMGPPETLKLVLPLAKNINVLDGNKYTLLGRMAGGGKKESVELLLQYGAQPNIEGQKKSPLQLAAESFSKLSSFDVNLHSKKQARHQIINLLIEKNADVENTTVEINYKNESFFHWVCSMGSNDTLKLLLKQSQFIQSVNALGENKYSALGKAISQENWNNAILLIKSGALPSIQGEAKSPLQLAAEKLSEYNKKDINNILELLIINGADIENTRINYKRKEESFIYWACKANCYEILEIALPLLKVKNIINELDSNSCTILGRLASEGEYESVELLLKHGASPNIEGQTKTPLQLAIESFYLIQFNRENMKKIIMLLIKNHADLDNFRVKYKGKEEPFLCWALENISEELLFILKFTKKIDTLNTNGDTLLTQAVNAHKDTKYETKVDIINLCIEMGADINNFNSLGKKSLQQWASKAPERKTVLDALSKKGF
jgi:ankyrin repeat protein